MRILWVLILLSVVLFTQGCDTNPRIVETPVYVDVPVVVACVDSIPKEPVYETTRLKATDDLPFVADAYMVETAQKDIHITQLRALLAGCVKP